MTYTIPEGSPLTHPVFQCCGETYFQAPQAEYHLWRVHNTPLALAAGEVLTLQVLTWPKPEGAHE